MKNSEPGSAMDVSCTDDDYPPVSSKDDEDSAVELGYQGWAARRLVRACHRIFVNSNNLGAGNNLIPTSVDHRGVIYWCLSNINADAVSSAASAAASEADLRNEDVFHDGLTDFYHVWTLAEAFLLDSAPLPAAPLLRWLKMYSQSGEDEEARWALDETERVALEADSLGGSADPTPAYWDALESLIVGVLPRRAAGMLRSHPEGRNNAGEFGAVARQLEKMPLLLPEEAGGGDGAEAQLDREGFFETWTRWQKGCKAAAASFGFVAGAGAGAGAGGGRGVGTGGGDGRLRLRWLWGTLCGERGCLVEATDSWSGLFAAVLAFERPDMRKEEVASVMRECARTHPHHQVEEFLLNVIRDASSGAVESILRFASENGKTLALSACAAHLVDLLFRADQLSVTHAQRRWFFRRLADRLKVFPCGGWELAATYEDVGGDVSDDDHAGLLRDIARAVVPVSERAAHELVEWCRVNGLGEEVAAAVCRARGEAWTGKAGLSTGATGTAVELGGVLGRGDRCAAADSGRVPGACGKAAYWLSRGGGGVRLERLCAEVSERLMVEVSRRRTAGVDDDIEAQQAVLAEAEGVLAAIPPGPAGPELSFLQRYKAIADTLLGDAVEGEDQSMEEDSLGPRAYLAGELAVGLLAPRDGDAPGVVLQPPPPTRAWAHLIRLAVPALRAQAGIFSGGGGGGGGGAGEGWLVEGLASGSAVEAPVSVQQVHALLAKMQALVASESRVGSERPDRQSTLPSAPAPYGFRGGRREVLEIRHALVGCLGAAMMVQNAEETAPDEGGRGGWKAAAGRGGGKRLPAGALIVPRVDV